MCVDVAVVCGVVCVGFAVVDAVSRAFDVGEGSWSFVRALLNISK